MTDCSPPGHRSTPSTLTATKRRFRRNLSGQPVSYQYDAANRLIAATVGKAKTAFAYDGDGNRISQIAPAGTYSYVNDVGTALPVVLQESGPDGALSYAYGLGLISESSTSVNNFYHYDGLGSVIALSNASGIPSAAYIYDAWGNSLQIAPPTIGTKNKFLFTGEALDSGTQLYYLRARYYDTIAGRFTSKDPFSGNTGVPLTTNRFVYVLNRPTLFSDPSGRSAENTPDIEAAFQPMITSADLENANSTSPVAPRIATAAASDLNSKLGSLEDDILGWITFFACLSGDPCEGLSNPIPGLPLLPRAPNPALPGSRTYQASAPFKPIG